MATSTVVVPVRIRIRVLLSLMLMALGAWVFLVPLVGPYFRFGFDTATRWRFSQLHGVTSLGPGIAIFLGGVLLLSRRRLLADIGALGVLAGGVWLVVVPSLHGLWSPSALTPQPAGARHTAWLWIAYFYGPGALRDLPLRPRPSAVPPPPHRRPPDHAAAPTSRALAAERGYAHPRLLN